jgi:hypothetical protein
MEIDAIDGSTVSLNSRRIRGGLASSRLFAAGLEDTSVTWALAREYTASTEITARSKANASRATIYNEYFTLATYVR